MLLVLWFASDDSATLCTSGLVDDIMFSRNSANTDTGLWPIVHRDSMARCFRGRSLLSTIALFKRSWLAVDHINYTAAAVSLVLIFCYNSNIVALLVYTEQNELQKKTVAELCTI